ncbi:MAG: M13 family metallopeptidase [Cyclobacteriaceae bacterium]|nr:M13 family metallopeptidase [Cyclobacteriaceae bacterium]
MFIRNITKIVVIGLLAVVSSCTSPESNTGEIIQAIDLSNMDSTISPADDFFMFVNGKWVEKTEIPSDQGRWGSFNELREVNNKTVLKVLEEAAKSGKYEEGTDQYKASSFYSIGMDSLLAEKSGVQALQPALDKIAAISSKVGLQKYLSEQQIYGGGFFFGFFIYTDLKNSSEMTAYLTQGGLGLPDRDYYTKEDAKSVELRKKYVKHIERMLNLMGDDEESAKDQASNIMALETRMAEVSMTNVEKRNIPALYNKYALSDLEKVVPSINWEMYLADMGVIGVDTLIVMQPKFMVEYQEIVDDTPMDEIKDYLRWRLVDEMASVLSNDFVQANFDFFSKELRGIEEMRPRWKRVLGRTNGALGEAIGKLYVDETFPPEAKEKAQKMVENIKFSYADRIKKLDWMSDSTKEKALEKLKKMMVKIGYPDEWRDYSALVVENDPENSSYAQNIMNAAKFRFEYQLSKLGKPVNKKEWGMTPQTVNAYFNPTNNEIVFPAAILQPPFYNYKADEAVNYGGIGAVIGHEISHCFDDQGSRFDADGNMVNWWGDVDLKNFQARTGKLVAQYDNYEPLDSVNVNGAFTLGENIGDLGGVSAAYDGLQRYFSENGRPENLDGFTPEQRFFISWSTIWRIKYKDETLRTQVNTDPHSPGMYRANGPISNLPEFYEAFNVQEGDKMYRHDSVRVKIW